MKPIEDVVIVGGGPAGANCALELAKNGIYPFLLDDSHPREKPCGGGISPQIIEKYPFVERFRPEGFTFDTYRIISCTNHQVISKVRKNGFCISRKIFDEGLLRMAVDKGATLIREKVLDLEWKSDHWLIKTNKSILSSPLIIGADGVNSIVRRKTIGRISTNNLALTFGYRTSTLDGNVASIKFLAEFPGYIWVFPTKDYTNIGIGGELKYGHSLKDLLNKFICSYCPKTKIISTYSALVPSAKDPTFFNLPCATKEWILIGDAAGHADPISGGGIFYALWGGSLAAQAITQNDPRSYDYLWKEAFGKNLIERCESKDSYYDPVQLEIKLFLGLANKMYTWL
jgi:digeranylgeranylglycerophospholipid reductase